MLYQIMNPMKVYHRFRQKTFNIAISNSLVSMKQRKMNNKMNQRTGNT